MTINTAITITRVGRHVTTPYTTPVPRREKARTDSSTDKPDRMLETRRPGFTLRTDSLQVRGPIHAISRGWVYLNTLSTREKLVVV